MDTFEMLKRLLSQNEFELLLPDQTGAKEKNTDKTDIRLVYQMNDTIESFLVFKEARMTGTYKEDYEGAIEASFYRDGDDYALVVRQEEEAGVVTILFKTLELETNLYNYGDIAHFWRKGCRVVYGRLPLHFPPRIYINSLSFRFTTQYININVIITKNNRFISIHF